MSAPSGDEAGATAPFRRAETREQAALLLAPRHYPFLRALMGEERGAAELARLLGEDVRRTHYLLGRFVRAGLVEVVGTRPRAGRAVKRHRMSPDWLVPFDLTDAETLLELARAQMLPRMERFLSLQAEAVRNVPLSWGVRLARPSPGALDVSFVDERGKEAVPDLPLLSNWQTVRLTRDEALRLRDELERLRERWGGRDEPQERPFTLGLFLGEGDLHGG